MIPLSFSNQARARAQALAAGGGAILRGERGERGESRAERPEGTLFGQLHPAAVTVTVTVTQPAGDGQLCGRSAADLGVVLCNPLGYEALSVHRTYRELAERLAAAGIPALRFDHAGTGDSAGDLADAGVRAWLDGVGAAMAELRRRTGAARIALFGVRFGATLAALAAREQGGVDALVLWAPVASGRLYARELRAFSAAQKVPPRVNGDLEVGGVLFPARTMAEIATVDLEGALDADRVLVLSRSEAGYAGMMRDDPYQVVVPSAELDRIVTWLSREPPGDADGRRRPRESGLYASVPQRPPQGEPAARPSEVAVAVAVAVTGRDAQGRTVPLVETALRFGEEQRLFGIVTPPHSAGRRRPAVILLNVGADHHVGPHRMNVDLARQLAARGYLALRFDASGLGDSPAAPGKAANRIYTKDAVADVRSAMDLLAERHGVRTFVLVGLCSGAFTAFHTTAVDRRVVGQVLISTYAFEWREGDPVAPTKRAGFASTRSYLRMALERDAWARALRGEVNLRGIAAALLERLKTRRGARNTVERTFVAMCERGVESLLVSAWGDAGLDTIGRYLGTDARRMRRHPRFALEIVEGADHTFTSIASQRELYRMVTRHLHAHFG